MEGMEEFGIFLGAFIIFWIIISILLPFFVVGIFVRLGKMNRQLDIANKFLSVISIPPKPKETINGSFVEFKGKAPPSV